MLFYIKTFHRYLRSLQLPVLHSIAMLAYLPVHNKRVQSNKHVSGSLSDACSSSSSRRGIVGAFFLPKCHLLPSLSFSSWNHLQTDPVFSVLCCCFQWQVCVSACLCVTDREGESYRQSKPIGVILFLVKYNQGPVQTDSCSRCVSPLCPVFPACPVITVSSGLQADPGDTVSAVWSFHDEIQILMVIVLVVQHVAYYTLHTATCQVCQGLCSSLRHTETGNISGTGNRKGFPRIPTWHMFVLELRRTSVI